MIINFANPCYISVANNTQELVKKININIKAFKKCYIEVTKYLTSITMSKENIQDFLELTDTDRTLSEEHNYIMLDNLDDSLIINDHAIYKNGLDNNRTVEQSLEDAIIDVTGLDDNFATTSFDAVDLSDHNYTNCVNNKMPAANVNLALLIQKTSNLHLTCKFCNKFFANTTSLTRHLRSHTKEKPFKCQICDKSFSQQSNLWKHIRIHTGERPFECPECKRKFSQRANMKKHMLIHSGEKPHECQYCWKTFTQLANRNKHMQLHLGCQPHKCKYCDKTFAQRSNMLKHQYLHEEVKPFSCPMCRVCFTQHGNLKKHLALHTNEKPHGCQYCGKMYIQKTSLTKHEEQCTKLGEQCTKLNELPTVFNVESNSYIRIIQLDGTQKNFYFNDKKELIKLEGSIPEIE